MKNRIIFCFVILMVMSLLTFASIAEGAGEDVYYIGDYAYSYKEDGTIIIVNALCGRRDETEEYLIDYSEDAMNYIPSSINGISVTEIGDEVFSSLYITSWTVPGTIKKIGNRAFANSEVEP